MRLIFMGTPPVAATILGKLIKAEHELVAVYTQPPRVAGRGHKLQKTAVHTLAESQNLPVESPLSFRDEQTITKLKTYQPDVIILVAYGLILPQAVLDIPPQGCLNVHASLLPRWRGAAPIERAILAGDNMTGVTLMKMEAGLDTGPIVATEKMPMTQGVTSGDLLEAMANVGGQLLLKHLKNYVNGKCVSVPQSEKGITYAHKIEKSEAQLDFCQSAIKLERKIRAFNPRPGAWFVWQGSRYKVWKASVVDLKEQHSHAPGTVVTTPMVIQTGEGGLSIDVIQKEGGKKLVIEEFLRGVSLKGGCVIQ